MTSKSWRGVTELDHIPQLAVAARLGLPARRQAAMCITGIVCSNQHAVQLLCNSLQLALLGLLQSYTGLAAGHLGTMLMDAQYNLICDVCAEHPCSQIADGDGLPIVTQPHQTRRGVTGLMS